MRLIVPYLWVFVGAGVGGALRHAANRAGLAIFGSGFPVGTLFVNVVGCFVIGILTSAFAFRGEWFSQHPRLLLTTGVLGGFTTFLHIFAGCRVDDRARPRRARCGLCPRLRGRRSGRGVCRYVFRTADLQMRT